ncbi:MAG: amidohydrolase family protein [Clostridiales bacterium]
MDFKSKFLFIKNFLENSALKLADVIPMVSENQANHLGLEKVLGTLGAGKFSNITIMKNDYEVMSTIVKGEVVYENQL